MRHPKQETTSDNRIIALGPFLVRFRRCKHDGFDPRCSEFDTRKTPNNDTGSGLFICAIPGCANTFPLKTDLSARPTFWCESLT